ncbi:MAG: hypothetical protein D6711_06855 [Chloroflexi bacterium]|nr:MAG: hypothetical protein D6711_06855 [Chloroflexota bacterium]
MNNDYQTAEEEYSLILEEVAKEFQVDTRLLHSLIEYEQSKVHLLKRRGAKNDLRQIIERWIEEQTS